AVRLRRDRDRDRGQVGGERGPRAVLDLRDVAAVVVADHELLVGRHPDRGSVDLDADAEALERGQDRAQVGRLRLLDRVAGAGPWRGPEEAAALDGLRADAAVAAAQALDAGPAEDVRADAVDLGAEGDEEAAEVLHVRLRRGVRDRRL